MIRNLEESRTGILLIRKAILKKSQLIESLVIIISASVLALLLMRNIFLSVLVFGDNPLVTEKSWSIIGQYFLSGWRSAAYGENSPWPTGYIFLYLFSYIGTFFGENFGLAFNFLMNLSLPLGFVSFYIFSEKFCQRTAIRIFGSALYLINPVVLSYYVSGGSMWVLVFIPLSLNYFINFLDEPNLKELAKSGVFSGLIMWTFPTFSIIFYSFLAILFLLYASQKKLDFVKKALPMLLIFALILVSCNISYLYALQVYSQSPQFGYTPLSVLADFKYTYNDISTSSLIRLAGNRGSPQVPLGYENVNNIRNEFGYVMPAITLFSIIWIMQEKNERLRLRTLSMFCISLAIILFAISLKFLANSEYDWIINSVSLLWTLRNPFKLQILLVYSVIPIFIYSIDKIYLKYKQMLNERNIKMSAVLALILLLGVSHIYLYNSYAFKGDMGITEAYSEIEKLLPDEIIENIINDSLSRTGWEYRGVILPFSHLTELHTQFTNPLLYPARLGINSRISSELASFLMTESDIGNFLRMLSTKYVYVIPPEYQKDSPWGGPFPIITVKDYHALLRGLESGSEKVALDGTYLFIVENALPRIYLSDKIVYYSNIEKMPNLNSSIFKDSPVFFELNYEDTQVIEETVHFEEDFESFRDAWFAEGSWEVIDGELVGISTEFGQHIMLTDKISNFTASYKIKWTQGEVFEQGFFFRAGQDPRTQSYIVFLSSYGEGTVRLCIRDGPHNSTLLQAENFSPQRGEWYDVGVSAVGSNIQVRINGELMINATDGRFESGYAGFMSWAGTKEEVHYDDLRADYNHTKALSRYTWDLPFEDTQKVNILLGGDLSKTNSTLEFWIDGNKHTALVSVEDNLIELGHFELNKGTHELVLVSDNTISTKKLMDGSSFRLFFVNPYQSGYSILDESTLKVENGLIETGSRYDDFILRLKFKCNFGRETFHGPNILFSWNDYGYFRLIFHKNGYMEFTKNNEVLFVKNVVLNSDYNDFRLIKERNTISIYINGEHFFMFSDPSLQSTGKIGIGSEGSVTYFKDITITQAPYVSGVWIESSTDDNCASIILADEGAGKFSLLINQTSPSPHILCLGENYDPKWKLKIDNEILDNNFRINLYANGWIVDCQPGVHMVEIYYEPNATYVPLLYFSIASAIILTIIVYLPHSIMKKIYTFIRNKKIKLSFLIT